MGINSLLYSPAISHQDLSLVQASQSPTDMDNSGVGQPMATQRIRWDRG